MASPLRLGRLVAVLMVLGAALFVVGVALERGDHHDTPATTVAASPDQGGHDEAAEAAEGHPAVENSDEKVLGVNVESPGVVAVGVGVSLVLAAAAWLKQRRAVFVVVAVFAAAFAVLDVAEIFHLLDRSESGLAVLAAVVAVIHVLAAIASVAGTTTARSDARPMAVAGLSCH
jgi:hypothetical protein